MLASSSSPDYEGKFIVVSSDPSGCSSSLHRTLSSNWKVYKIGNQEE